MRRVALEVKALLDEIGIARLAKNQWIAGGMHVNVRIQPRWTFSDVRRAALCVVREIERRAPQLASSKWWKEERQRCFSRLTTQNAKDLDNLFRIFGTAASGCSRLNATPLE